jgi:hypothetical protein
MKKEVAYSRTVFSADVIREALRAATADQDEEQITSGLRTARRGNETWTFDSDEKFLASIVVSLLPLCLLHYGRGKIGLTFGLYRLNMNLEVSASNRQEIESIFEVFDRHRSDSVIPEPEPPPSEPPSPPTVFIGHGRSQQWRDLKDHLHEQHGLPVQAYEVSARQAMQFAISSRSSL